MSKKDEFKDFVRKNPRLVNYIKSGEMTWQKFYEIYDIYGEDKEAWQDYLTDGTKILAGASFLDILKNIDLDSVQSGVNSIQRVVSVLQEITNKKATPSTTYQPRPVYKSFDD